MSRAVVDAGPASPDVESASWPMGSEQSAERIVLRHRSPHNGSAWTELSDIRHAMKVSRRGGAPFSQLLRILRPESRALTFTDRWRHGSSILDEHQVTGADIDTARVLFSQVDPDEQDYCQEQLADKLGAGRLSDGIDRAERNDHRMYIMAALGGLAYYSVLDLDAEDPKNTYENLIEALAGYDALRARHDELKERVEAIASRTLFHRIGLLGASAVRGVYRLITSPVTVPVMRVYGWWHGQKVAKSSEVRRARHWALGFQGLAVLLGLGIAFYRFTKGSPFDPPDTNMAVPGDDPVIDPSATIEAPPSSKQPDAPLQLPPNDPTTPVATFSESALVTHDGEGWASQFAQMNINYTPDFMDKVGPWLESKGFAYRYFDSKLMRWSWGMNLKNIDSASLRELYARAVQEGAARPKTLAPA